MLSKQIDIDNLKFRKILYFYNVQELCLTPLVYFLKNKFYINCENNNRYLLKHIKKVYNVIKTID
jgi:hypothetical protein